MYPLMYLILIIYETVGVLYFVRLVVLYFVVDQINCTPMYIDYHFLEDALQTRQRAKRLWDVQIPDNVAKAKKHSKCNSMSNALDIDADSDGGIEDVDSIVSNMTLSLTNFQSIDRYAQHVQKFVRHVREKGINVILMSPGMFKRNINTSFLDSAPKKNKNRNKKSVSHQSSNSLQSSPGGSLKEHSASVYWRVHLVFLLTNGSLMSAERQAELARDMLKLSLHGNVASAGDTVSSRNSFANTNTVAKQKKIGSTANITIESNCIGISLDYVHEDTLLLELIEEVLNNKDVSYYPVRTLLRYIRSKKEAMLVAGNGKGDTDSWLRCLMQLLPQAIQNQKPGISGPIFNEISPQFSIGNILQGKTIVEFPTFFVSTPEYMEHLSCPIVSLSPFKVQVPSDISTVTNYDGENDLNGKKRTRSDSMKTEVNVKKVCEAVPSADAEQFPRNESVVEKCEDSDLATEQVGDHILERGSALTALLESYIHADVAMLQEHDDELKEDALCANELCAPVHPS